MFSAYAFCVFLACIITESCSVRLYLHVHHTRSFDDDEDEMGQQEVIDTGKYELRRRRRSLDDPQFLPVSADEEAAEVRDRPSVDQFRKVISDAGLAGGWTVEDQEDLEEDAWKGRRNADEVAQLVKIQLKKDKKKEKEDPNKKGRMWAFGQLISGVIFGKRVYKQSPGSYAKFASEYGMLVFMPIMIVITVVHILLWYIWFTKKAAASKKD